MPKVKNKERILKAAREKHQGSYKGRHIRIKADLSGEIHKGQETMGRCILSPEIK
jgi:hypothetical protein